MVPSRIDPLWQAARAGDRDRYLAALLVGEPARKRLMALAAFNGDLVAIGEKVSDPRLGHIRLQWWRDALARVRAGGTTGSPIADALGQVVSSYPGVISMLDCAVDAREFDIEGGVMADWPALRRYLEKTQSGLFCAAAEVLGLGAQHTVGHDAGLAYGIGRLLAGLPHDAAKGRLFLPRDVLERHGIAAEDPFSGGLGEGLGPVVAELADEAGLCLERARAGVALLGADGVAAFLPLALAGGDLRVLRAGVGKAPPRFTGRAPPMRIARLTWAAMTGRL